MCAAAGLHFNRGQRAFFFALGYLGWFLSPWLLIIATIAVVFAIYRRQFASDALMSLDAKAPTTRAAGSRPRKRS